MSRSYATLTLALLALSLGAAAQDETPPAPQVTLTPREILDRAQDMLDSGVREPRFLKQALELAEQVLDRDPANTQALLVAGDILISGGQGANFDRARDYFKRVLDLEPSNFRANLGTGKIYLGNRTWRQARFFLEQAEAVAPAERQGEVKRLLALVYAGLGEATRSIEKAQAAVQADPEDLDSLQTLVEIRLEIARRDPRQLAPAVAEAEDFVKRAAQEVEQAPWERSRLLRLLQAYQDQTNILREYHNSLYERDVHNQPTDRLRPGNSAEASAVLMRLAEKMRLDAQLRTVLTEHDVVTVLERAVEYEPENVRYLETLADGYQRISDRDKAIATYQRILAVQPDHAAATEQLRRLGAPAQPPAAEAPTTTGS